MHLHQGAGPTVCQDKGTPFEQLPRSYVARSLSIQQDHWVYLQRGSNLADGSQRGIGHFALNLRNVGSIHFCFERQLFLRKALGKALAAQILCQSFSQYFETFVHAPSVAGRGLQIHGI